MMEMLIWILYTLDYICCNYHYCIIFYPGRWVTGYVKHSETGELIKIPLEWKACFSCLYPDFGFCLVMWDGFHMIGFIP